MGNYNKDDNWSSLKTTYGHNTHAGEKVMLTDAEIYYEIYGSGQPLLLLHGNGQSINSFKNQISEFSKKYKVIAVDTRGHGYSTDLSTGALTYEIFAADMRHLLDSLKIPKADILGWSDGAITGIIMALKYPSYVNKLAVMSANLFPKPGALKDIVFVLMKELIDDLKYNQDIHSARQRRIYELIFNEPHLTFIELNNIISPVLVMAGENDVIFESHTREIARSIPDSQLMIFKNADHFAPFSVAAEFNKAVLEFLNG
ncbi:MAG: alpha/beta hydrolase [Mucilaginibacter sp.]|nr:alpha/beta hydrolase [Mucilaginibacter sp.]